MKVIFAVILATVATVQGTSSPFTLDNRQLQNNYYNNGGNGGYNYGGFENYEEYMRYQLSQRSFTTTGCSTVKSEYGWNSVYITFRLCDKCNAKSTGAGCDNSNGDYIVSMAEFGETFGEYWAEMTYQDRNAAPFTCAKLEEYAEAQMYNNQQNYYNGQQQQQQQWYNNNNMEYFVGPLCNGGSKIETGLFYDEDCTNPVEGTSLADVLGFEPSNTATEPPVCVPCMQTNYNNGGGGQGELNPLCDRMLEESGRCDRTRRQTDYDQFWQNNMQQGGGGENRYAYGNACSLIDSLPHMKTMKRQQTAFRAVVWSIVAVSVIGLAFFVYKKGYLKDLESFKGVQFMWDNKKKKDKTKTAYADNSDYQRQTDADMT